MLTAVKKLPCVGKVAVLSKGCQWGRELEGREVRKVGKDRRVLPL
jgi:hypothetical protein